MTMRKVWRLGAVWLLGMVTVACSSDDGQLGTGGGGVSGVPAVDVPAPAPPTGAGNNATQPGATAPVDDTPQAVPPAMDDAAAAPGGAAGAAAPPTDATDPMDTTDMGGGDPGPSTGAQPSPPGPEDGDPSAPIFAHPEVACGGPAGAFGLGSANHTMDGREMIVSYPCNKHEGAPVTFILNLHGTTPVNLHFYQHGYFAAHAFIESHNLIVVTPSSVVQQWGNGDNGQDEPHLMNIIDWVYSSFSGLDIRGMWVAGHSWGGGYTARFGCKAELADKVKGLVMQSGGSVGGFGGAACADRVSVIISTAEGDGRMPSDQTSVASGHGCGAAQTEVIASINDHTFWPDCDPGFVHANYYMREKEHATSMDREVVESIVDWIKLGRQ